jgi:RNA polymerase sigma factor (sigma-70 family)
MFSDIRGLVESCIERDEKAWRKFVERFSGLLYYSARERLRRNNIAFGQHDIEDIVQGVFAEIWEKGWLEKVKKRKKITAWLSIMGQTRALNYMRNKRERLLRPNEIFRINNIAAAGGGKLDEELMRQLEKLIVKFSPREKIILKLNVVHGKAHKEIAEFMKIPINTVSTIIARKKNLVREQLKEL